jgi:hypothetical protein
MTVEIDLFTLVILVVVMFVAALVLLMIWQLKKTGQKADALLCELQRELLPTLRDCREIAARINRVSATIEAGGDQARNLLMTLDEISTSVRRSMHFFRQDAFTMGENAACLISGLKAASKVFFKHTQDKGD